MGSVRDRERETMTESESERKSKRLRKIENWPRQHGIRNMIFLNFRFEYSYNLLEACSSLCRGR